MSSSRGNDHQQRVLRYWWMLELFSPQQVPRSTRPARQPADRQVIEWQPSQPLPWEVLSEPRARDGRRRVWQHTVYLGVYDLQAVSERLQRKFAVDADAYDERPAGRSACAGLLVDERGALVPDSAILSSALWAVARIERAGPGRRNWADGFPEAAQAFTEAVEQRKRGPAPEELQVAAEDARSLQQLLRLAHRASGVTGIPDLATDRVVIQSVAVFPRRTEDGADLDFLNSFYLDDLHAVRTDVRGSHREGAALSAYLTADSEIDADRRVDVVATPEAVDAGLLIDRLPKGRWPTNPDHGLASSQQFAVNCALADLAPSRGLIGVNGPPGTGKTTMLRDVLAGNVVERARRLAQLARPEHAFTDTTHRWTAHDGHRRSVRQLRPELTGFEMVVASANNAAVENVTDEMPGRSAIDGRWVPVADYFAGIATAVRTEASSEDQPGDRDEPAWGLVAARLGNRRNRAAFHSALWFDKTHPKSQHGHDTIPRLQTRLAQWRDAAAPHKTWQQARDDFRHAEQRVDALIEERRQAQERLHAYAQTSRQLTQLRAQRDHNRVQLQEVEAHLTGQGRIERQLAEDLDRARAQYDQHRAVRPGVLETLLSLGRVLREWRTVLAPIAEELQAAEGRCQEAAAGAHELEDRRRLLISELETVEAELASTERRLAGLRAQCVEDEQRYAPGYPDSAWTGERRQLHAPWLDTEIDAARSELFLAALQLHQDFLANTAGEMSHGLRAALEVVAGSCPHRLEPAKRQAAWELFFLVVPLVSTTFASFGRMFTGLGRESLGWLLIDEAGQAAPQYAAGAIWRAQRVLAVGDPLQLQPVVTIPQKAQRDIARAYRLSATWIPPLASVQTLADRVSVFGTLLDQGEERTWVGAPLTVHRRCDEPMFSLCNQIAYNGIMVNGVHRDADGPAEHDPFHERSGPLIAPSHWADEPAHTRGTHLQENQIARFEGALRYLAEKGVDASKVIAISPFRDMADRLRALTATYPGLTAGTIHTAQGKQALVVFLVLGGDPARPGAHAWAASSVNLVNVAASRAVRRLYVIGDRAAWAKHNYFHQLALTLTPPSSWRTADPDVRSQPR
ncbi:MAG TPA: AAA domain-containing protein [Actinomycetaceae bacterium]|nr:AAA domain-containing protein [Actinomycetaceae bacterium]